jgi:U11-48K-like CHHC zinc finger
LKPKEGEEYCGEHLTNGKVACPLNRNHYVKQVDLEYHLKYKCDKRLIITKYFNKSFNTAAASNTTGVNIARTDTTKANTETLTVYDNPWLIEKINSIPFHKSYQDSILEHSSMNDRVLDCLIGKHARQQSSLLGNLDILGLLEGNLCFNER